MSQKCRKRRRTGLSSHRQIGTQGDRPSKALRETPKEHLTAVSCSCRRVHHRACAVLEGTLWSADHTLFRLSRVWPLLVFRVSSVCRCRVTDIPLPPKFRGDTITVTWRGLGIPEEMFYDRQCRRKERMMVWYFPDWTTFTSTGQHSGVKEVLDCGSGADTVNVNFCGTGSMRICSLMETTSRDEPLISLSHVSRKR